jgi:capsular polysaccharide biosynthesis protein
MHELPCARGLKAPGRAARLAWRVASARTPRPSFKVRSEAALELYPSVLNPGADLSGTAPDHFLRRATYAPEPFVQGVGRDIVYTRVGRALFAPEHGLIDQFSVGGGLNMPDDLLEREFAYEPDGALRVDDPDLEYVPGVSVPFSHYGYSAFGHFVLDSLLQVHLYERALHSGEARLVHWRLQEAWMQTALEACGLPRPAQHELTRPFALLQHAELSSALAAYGVYHPGAYSRRFFDWLAARVGPGASAPARKLYIRRSEGSPRPIGNSAALEDLARRHGFEVLDPRDHSFAEQVRAFAGADTVMSAWGSTLTLAPLLRGPRRVIELLPGTVTDPWFFSQVVVHGLDYVPVLQAAEPSGAFEADLDALERVLRTLQAAG